MWGEWIDTSLGEMIELKRGYDLPKRERAQGAVPLVSSSGVSDHQAEAKVKGPGVVTGRYGTLGEVFFVREDFWPLNTTLYVRDFKGSDPRFISYFLRGLDYLAYSDKAAVPGLNRNHLHQARISFPRHLPEQRAIAHILGTLDDRIDLSGRMKETLEGMARALFKSWFVDFDPVRAKMKGRWRHGESLPGLPAELYALFPDRLVASELGEVPEGWEVSNLADFAELNPESWSKGNAPDAIDYVDLSNTKWGSIQSVTGHSWEAAPSRARRVLRPWDTIVGTVRPGNGSYGLVLSEGLTGSTGFAVLRPSEPKYRPFVYLAATEPRNIDRLAHLAHGAAYPAVRPSVVAKTRVMGADNEVHSTFAELLEPMFERVAIGDRESLTLATLRDTLLPRLISGELRVPDAERMVASAT